jgi:iron complex outermembrane receptor protein
MRTPSRVDSDIQIQSFVQPSPLLYLEVRGNPDLKAERLIGSELGYRNLVFPSLYVDFAAFYNDYDDLTSYGTGAVSVRQTPRSHTVFSVPTVNGAEAKTYGFEIAPSWRPAPRWELKGAYSYLNLRARSRPGFTDAGTVNRYNGSSPHHQVIVRSALTLPGNLELDQTYRYVSALASQRVGAYHTGDLRLGWRLGENVEFSVAGHNLLQPHHAEFGRENRPIVEVKRSVFARVTISQ